MKSDQTTVQTRVEEVLQLRLVGALPTDICRHARDEKWNVSVRQVQRYIAAADKLLLANVEKNRDRLMAFHYSARRALFARAMSVSDYSTARQLLNDEAKLLGLFDSEITAQLEEMRRQLAELTAANGHSAPAQATDAAASQPDGASRSSGESGARSPAG